MQIWKFLLLGVTGDLAKLKILPALSQFAFLNQEEVQIDFIGLSRSQANETELKKILEKNSPDGKIYLNSMEFWQGDYTDPAWYEKLLTEKHSEDRAVIYLAVPPSVFPQFLEKVCPYGKEDLDILIEKPFGSDSKEAWQLLQSIYHCGLQENVKFTDHYLFKTETLLSPAEQKNLKKFENKVPTKITIRALETVSVSERLSYYSKIGCLKDMFVHLFSLAQLGLGLTLDKETSHKLLDKITVKKLFSGQYSSLGLQSGDLDINTDTYFFLEFETLSKTKIIMESGKMLQDKTTDIKIEFDDGSIFYWNVYPERKFEVVSAELSFSFSLNKAEKLDHVNMFEKVLQRNYVNFFKQEDVLLSWKLFDVVEAHKNFKAAIPSKYQDGVYPVQWISKRVRG